MLISLKNVVAHETTYLFQKLSHDLKYVLIMCFMSWIYSHMSKKVFLRHTHFDWSFSNLTTFLGTLILHYVSEIKVKIFCYMLRRQALSSNPIWVVIFWRFWRNVQQLFNTRVIVERHAFPLQKIFKIYDRNSIFIYWLNELYFYVILVQ